MQRIAWAGGIGILCSWAVGCAFDTGGLSLPALPADDDAGLRMGADAPSAEPDAPSPDASSPDASPPDASPPDADPNACPLGYVADPVTGSAYRVVPSYGNWLTAEADCEDDGNGTHLVVIDDATELARVGALTLPFQLWIGLTDRKQEDHFRWVTGPFTRQIDLPWKAGEPNDSNGEDCVELTETDEYNDEDCVTGINQYICECDHIPAKGGAY